VGKGRLDPGAEPTSGDCEVWEQAGSLGRLALFHLFHSGLQSPGSSLIHTCFTCRYDPGVQPAPCLHTTFCQKKKKKFKTLSHELGMHFIYLHLKYILRVVLHKSVKSYKYV
jgi:hypothetical protein